MDSTPKGDGKKALSCPLVLQLLDARAQGQCADGVDVCSVCKRSADCWPGCLWTLFLGMLHLCSDTLTPGVGAGAGRIRTSWQDQDLPFCADPAVGVDADTAGKCVL
eukprot:1160739-Pelagomonas_calceolata.AAC.2